MIFSHKTKQKNGFSLIEILISLAVLATISGIAVSVFKNVNEKQALDKSRLSVLAILNEARSASLASKDSSDHGVYLEEDKITTFTGSSYVQSDPKNIAYYFNSLVKISSPVPKTLVFKKTTGVLLDSSAQTISLSLRNKAEENLSISVFLTGLVQKNAQ